MQFYVKSYKAQIEKYGLGTFENIVDVPDIPLPFRQMSRAQAVSEAIDKIKNQKQSSEAVPGRQQVSVKRQGSQFCNFIQQCLEDEGSDSG